MPSMLPLRKIIGHLLMNRERSCFSRSALALGVNLSVIDPHYHILFSIYVVLLVFISNKL